MKKTIFLASSLILIFFSPGAGADSGNFAIDPASNLFDVANMMPGGEYSSKEFTITNKGESAEDVQFQIKITTNPEKLSEKLYLKVNNESGDCVWGYSCGEKKSLVELDLAEIKIGKLEKGESKRFVFVILFDPSAGNEFQNSGLSFDIAIGYAGGKTTDPDSSGEDDEGDNDNDEGDNDDSKGKKKKNKEKKNTLGQTSLAGNVNFGPYVNAGASDSEENRKREKDEGEVAGTAAGIAEGVSAEFCKGWPKWAWVLIFLISSFFVMNRGVKDYIRKKIDWKLPLAFFVAAAIFWIVFDRCRENFWFLHGIALVSLFMRFVYPLVLSKRKINKS